MKAADRVMSWGMPLLYVGPAFELPRHRKAVGFLCVGLDAPLEIEANGEARPSQSVLVEPDVVHHVGFRGRRIACLYLDRESPLLHSLASGMTAIGGGLYVDHGRTAGIIDALQGEHPLQEHRRARIAEAFGLPPSSDHAADARVARVLGSILADPGGRHHVEALARQVRLSESRIRHAFRDATGVPLRRFRLWARMGAGLSLIGRGASLTSAAHEAGFASSAHFSTAYRAMFGIKPSAVVRANPMLLGPKAIAAS